MTKDMCEVTFIHEDKVNRAKKDLAKQNPMDVANIIESSTATASHHLRLLKNLGIATYRKEGKLVYYSLDDEHVKHLVEKAFLHKREVASIG
ncbi:helix-turn-helix transcriptional regulator [Staphylococcus pseudintermedius]|nr:helix-turn-helix transcriptional regulator [Staphylococcus pseudintermedius]